MLGLFRADPRKKLQKAYEKKLEAAMFAQRNGDIKSYSLLSEEADHIYRQILQLEQ